MQWMVQDTGSFWVPSFWQVNFLELFFQCLQIKDGVVNIYKERANMASSLKDTDSIVNSLETAIGGVIHFIFAAFYLLIWNVSLVEVGVRVPTLVCKKQNKKLKGFAVMVVSPLQNVNLP